MRTLCKWRKQTNPKAYSLMMSQRHFDVLHCINVPYSDVMFDNFHALINVGKKYADKDIYFIAASFPTRLFPTPTFCQTRNFPWPDWLVHTPPWVTSVRRWGCRSRPGQRCAPWTTPPWPCLEQSPVHPRWYVMAPERKVSHISAIAPPRRAPGVRLEPDYEINQIQVSF